MQLGEQGRVVKTGVIGLGCRGIEQLKLLASMPDIDIHILCDQYQDRVDRAAAYLAGLGRQALQTTSAQAVIDCPDIEAVVIMTGWETHIDLAARAMAGGKHAAMEVGGASSVEECWRLVRAGRDTGKQCMLLENCCYGKEEMTLLRMIKQGVFGEIVHCQGGYQHDLRDEIGMGDVNRHYRQRHFLRRNGELYPTHELGPIFKYLDIHHGNRMLTLCSMASKAAGLKDWLRENRAGDALADAIVCQGDVVTTMIQCARGETILLTHDCTLPRPYSRGGRVQGTKGIWMEDNRSIFIDHVSPPVPGAWTHSWESDAPYMETYRPALWTAYEAFGKRGGHGGMDYLVLRAFFEAIQQGTVCPIDVYDTAALMCVTALSEQSVAMGGAPVAVPDFTDGAWLDRPDEAIGEYKLGG